MSPLLINTRPARTHVSIAAQHPPSTHPCLRCCSAPTRHAPMSPLLFSTRPTHTHVCIAAPHPPSTRPCLHCYSAPTQHTPMSPLLLLVWKSPRVVPQNFPEIGSLTNVTWPPPWSIFSLYYGAGTPRRRRRRRRRTIWSCPAADSTPRKKLSRSGPPHLI